IIHLFDNFILYFNQIKTCQFFADRFLYTLIWETRVLIFQFRCVSRVIIVSTLIIILCLHTRLVFLLILLQFLQTLLHVVSVVLLVNLLESWNGVQPNHVIFHYLIG